MKGRRISSFLVVAITILWAFHPVLAQQVSPDYSAEAHRTAVYAGALHVGEWQYQRWDNGYLVVWRMESSPSVPSVAVFDRDGTLIREVVVWLPGSVRVQLSDATVTKSGRMVVSGGAANSGGAIANFIVEFDPNGKIEHVVRTSPFVARRLCSISDDNVWAYGWDRTGARTGAYRMLRNYSFDKGQTEALLERTSLPKNLLMTGNMLSDIGLKCNDSEVVLFLAQTGELIQHKLGVADHLLRYKLPQLPEEVIITGYALTDDGEFFASMAEKSRPSIHALSHLQKTANNDTRWVPVKQPAVNGQEQRSLRLLGSDGDSLVHISDSFRDILTWSRVRKSSQNTPAESHETK